VFGGNPELTPETGKTLTMGLVLDRWQDWLFSLDYFDLAIEHTIGVADVALVCFDPGNRAAALCEKISRDPVNYNVNRIDGTIANLGRLNTKGFDFQTQYITALPDRLSLGSGLANLSLDLIWTHVDTLSFQSNPAVEPIDCAGTFGFPCSSQNVGAVTPKNRISLFATYTAGPFDAHLTWRWLQSTDSNVALLAALSGFKDPVISIPKVPSRSYLDLAFAYEFNEHLRARLSIANLLDTNPPLMANSVFANNTDAGTYDVFGRSYQFAIYYRF
jgi:outer membrane receptor protein involved in Fe transport